MARIELSSGLKNSIEVLKLLKKNQELKKLKKLHIGIGTFTNCRECGYTFMVMEKKSFTWCVYEHRNSDSIIINGKTGYISMNGELPYNDDSKWDYLANFSPEEYQKCSDKLAEMIIKFYKKNNS